MQVLFSGPTCGNIHFSLVLKVGVFSSERYFAGRKKEKVLPGPGVA